MADRQPFIAAGTEADGDVPPFQQGSIRRRYLDAMHRQGAGPQQTAMHKVAGRCGAAWCRQKALPADQGIQLVGQGTTGIEQQGILIC